MEETEGERSRICKNCNGAFTVTDFAISVCERLHIPLPTWCSMCQMQRRLAWRNERTLYKRISNEPGSSDVLISLYREDSPVATVYSHKYWQGDAWDPREFAMEYDSSRTFFEQFAELYRRVPWPNLTTWGNVNCEYDNLTKDCKDCYLCFGGGDSEYVSYATYGFEAKESSDLYFCNKVERCYECIDCSNCYSVRYSRHARSCIDSCFLFDCVNCSNCIGCVNLRNKQYCIFNKQYTKEEYQNYIASIDFGSFSAVEKLRERFESFKASFPRRFAMLVQTKECTGDNISNAFAVKNSFDIEAGAEYVEGSMIGGWNLKDVLNSSQVGIGAELVYDSFGIFKGASHMVCSLYSPTCSNSAYCYNCNGAENCFGCVGIKKGSYMILNKQYSKEEYFALVDQIKKDMTDLPYVDAKGREYPFGQFFPAELSPFGYNETMAAEYFPLQKEEAITQGFEWYEKVDTAQPEAVDWGQVPDSILDTGEEFKNKVFACQETGKVFRLSNLEWDLYKRLTIPLPRLHPETRHQKRFKARGGINLYKTKCSCAGDFSENALYKNTVRHDHGDGHCANTFQTVYNKETGATLYCERCYQAEFL